MSVLTPARVPIASGSPSSDAQPDVGEVAREHADAVAAHLGLRPVGVAVVHEPLGTGCRGIRPLVDRARPHDAEDAVGADAEAPVAQHGDLVVGEVELAVGIGEDHEVVAGAVTLREGDGLRHPPSLGSVACRPSESAMSRLPVAQVSNGS